MRLLTYDKARRRVWVCNKRIHHGLAGFLLWAAGLILMLDDKHDFPWLRDNP